MPKQTNFIKTQIRIPPALSKRIDSYAQRHELSRNEAMLVLMSKALGEYELLWPQPGNDAENKE